MHPQGTRERMWVASPAYLAHIHVFTRTIIENGPGRWRLRKKRSAGQLGAEQGDEPGS